MMNGKMVMAGGKMVVAGRKMVGMLMADTSGERQVGRGKC